MNIENIHSKGLSNALHYQCNTELSDLIAKFNPGALNVGPQYENFLTALAKEGQCYKIVRKSDLSEEKEDADHARDVILTGIGESLKASLRHFNPQVREAAKRLKIVFDEYNRPKNMIYQPYDAETASVNSLLKDWNGKYANDLITAELTGWTTELARRNAEFAQLAKNYNEQQAEKPDFRMIDARKETDEAYKKIIAVVKADIIRYGEQNYKTFVAELNELIKHYSDILAKSEGRKNAKKKDNE
jgi:hypothetical protein